MRDTNYTEVSADRVYPAGVSREHFSKRAKGLAVILYLLGLSYGAISLVMAALGLGMSKTLVYKTVQEVARRVPGMKQAQVFEGMQTPALGSDVTSVKVQGKWYPIGVAVDEQSGLVLTVDGLEGEDAAQPLVEAVGAEVLVTEDENGGG